MRGGSGGVEARVRPMHSIQMGACVHPTIHFTQCLLRTVSLFLLKYKNLLSSILWLVDVYLNVTEILPLIPGNSVKESENVSS